MPGLSGLGVAAALRGIGATGKGPLLAFTAFGTADYIQEMKEVGFDAVCRKPAELTQLEGMIFRLLGHESVDGFQVVLSTSELVPTPSRPRPDRSKRGVKRNATRSTAARQLRPFRRSLSPNGGIRPAFGGTAVPNARTSRLG
jgi:CheY-like chemotaxis protein